MDQIQVFVRSRPLTEREEKLKQCEAWEINANTTIQEINPQTKRPLANHFTFDHIFDAAASQRDVYEKSTSGLVHKAVLGFNGTILAYGQTSSGKTHTICGPPTAPGIIPQAMTQIFHEVAEEPSREFLLRVSYLEIYNEVIRDLLDVDNHPQVREDPVRGVFVDNLNETIVTNVTEVMEQFQAGQARRHVGRTNINEASSRSHTIFRMIIESRENLQVSGANLEDSNNAIRVSELNVVDLAGSERLSHTDAKGARLKEGAHINKSLLALSRVIYALSSVAGNGHINYRDSKLTRILSTALGGNSNTSIICNMTPAAIHAEETISTLKFALRAKRVKNKAVLNEVLDDAALLKQYQKEIEELRRKLKDDASKGEENTEMIDRKQLKTRLAEETRIRKEQEEKIDHLKQLIISGVGSLSAIGKEGDAASAGDGAGVPNRRETWAPAASRLLFSSADDETHRRLSNLALPSRVVENIKRSVERNSLGSVGASQEELEEEKEILQDRVTELENVLEEGSLKAEEMEGVIASLEDRIVSTASEAAALSDQLDAEQKQVVDLKSRLAEAAGELAAEKERAAKHASEVESSLEYARTDMEVLHRCRSEDKETFMMEIDMLQRENDKLRHINRSLNAEIADAHTARLDQEKALQQLAEQRRGDKDSANKSLSEIEGRLESARKDFAQSEKLVEEQKQRTATVEREYGAYKSTSEETIERLNEEVKAMSQTIDRDSILLRELEMQFRTSADLQKDVMSQNKAAEAEIESLRETLGAEKRRGSDLDATVVELRSLEQNWFVTSARWEMEAEDRLASTPSTISASTEMEWTLASTETQTEKEQTVEQDSQTEKEQEKEPVSTSSIPSALPSAIPVPGGKSAPRVSDLERALREAEGKLEKANGQLVQEKKHKEVLEGDLAKLRERTTQLRREHHSSGVSTRSSRAAENANKSAMTKIEDGFKKQMHNLEEKLRAKEEKMRTVMGDKSQLVQEKARLEREHRDLSRANKILDEKLRRLEASTTRARDQGRAIAQLEKQLDAAQREVGKTRESLSEAERRDRDSCNKLDATEKTLKETECNLKSKTEEGERLICQLKQAEDKISALDTTLAANKAELCSLENRIAALDRNLAQERAQLEKREAEHESVLAEKDEQFKLKEEELTQVQDSHAKETAATSIHMGQLKSSVRQLQDSLAATKDELAFEKGEKDALEANLASVKAALAAESSKLAEVKQTGADLEGKLADERAACSQKESERADLESEMFARIEEGSAADEARQKAEKLVETLKSDLETLAQAKAEVCEDLAREQMALTEQSAKLSQSKAEIGTLSASQTALQSTVQQLEEQVAAKSKDIEELTAAMTDAEMDSEGRVSELEGQLTETQKKLDNARTEIEKFKTRIEHLDERYAALEEESQQKLKEAQKTSQEDKAVLQKKLAEQAISMTFAQEEQDEKSSLAAAKDSANQDLKDSVKSLQTRNDALSMEVAKLKARSGAQVSATDAAEKSNTTNGTSSLSEREEDLAAELTEAKQEIIELELAVSSLHEEITQVQVKLPVAERTVKELQEDNEAKEQEITDLKKRLEQIIDQLHRKSRDSDRLVQIIESNQKLAEEDGDMTARMQELNTQLSKALQARQTAEKRAEKKADHIKKVKERANESIQKVVAAAKKKQEKYESKYAELAFQLEQGARDNRLLRSELTKTHTDPETELKVQLGRKQSRIRALERQIVKLRENQANVPPPAAGKARAGAGALAASQKENMANV